MKPEDIRVLTMDREFGGEKWLKWLESKGIGYVVRIKSNTIVNEYTHVNMARHASRREANEEKFWG